ncbi:MAG: 2'-5' RNA ligase family protein [Acidimicrobiia bacterium]
MARRRFAVALLLPRPLADEVDGLRRACGDAALERVPPHITIVPPVNVRADGVDAAFEVVRSAARDVGTSLSCSLGAAATFHPVNPVAYLPVGGDDLEPLHAACLVPPLFRNIDLAFVPHVTICSVAPPERLAAIVAALNDYSADVSFDGVHLLEQSDVDRTWRPIGEFAFARPRVVGTGGLVTEVSAGAVPGRAAWAFTARRDGAVVGTIGGWRDGATLRITELEVTEIGTGIGSLLLAAVERAGRESGAERLTAVDGSFLEHRGFVRDGDYLVRSL